MRKQEQSFGHQTDYKDGIKQGFITPTLDQLIETFLICCGTDGKSQKTITWYEVNLNRFSGFLKIRNMEKPVEDIGPAEFRRFVYHLQNEVTRWESYRPQKDDKGLSPYSIIGYAKTLKAFWSWLLNEGYIDYNPMLRVKMTKLPKKIIATFTPDLRLDTTSPGWTSEKICS